MKAVTWHGKRDVRVEQVPDPGIQQPTDVLVRITSTAICGSDLHLYEVLTMWMEEGDILGHEPMGVVEAVGKDVTHVKVGDRVVIPFNISCGACYFCDQQLYSQCDTTQVREHGKGAALFGYTKLYGQVPGGQAELLRVPMGHFGPIKVPDGPPDERFLYLSDILPTAWQAVAYADVPKGGTLAVFGLGPVGQFATRVAFQQGAERVIGVDLVTERLELARAHGVDVIDGATTDAVEAIVEMTGGRGADAVVDAVGMEAHGSLGLKLMQESAGMLPEKLAQQMTMKVGVDRMAALRAAVDATRRGGTLSISGVYGGAADPMPLMDMFDKQLQVRMGQCNVKRWVPEIMPLLTGDDDPLGVEELATHRLPLDEAPHAYEVFQKKQEECVKVVLKTA